MFGYGSGGDGNDWILCCLFLFGSCCCWSIWLILQGVVGSGIAFFVQAWCIARRGPVFFAMFIPLCTVIVTILGAIFLHKEVYTGSMAGAIGVVVGLYIVLWGKAKDIAPIANEAKLLPPSKINLEEPLLRNNLPADDIKEANGRNCV
ncbi:hypothetical protein CRG98_041559 [Punica granatum]|uniref:WAT1-related protein n=1 Tax=Punica granatum TaxID=22663 RepID=A0A2I0I260_PUNGR|nr:hypothetical protein CRG98_041559 [Punica granatum]